MKIAQATPRCGPPSWKYLDSLVQWTDYTARARPELGVQFLRIERYLPIDVARNALVDRFLESDADYLWFVDQDAAFLPGTLDRLLSRRLPIVSALEMMRLPGACYPMALKGPHATEAGQYRIQAPEIYEFVARSAYDATINEPQMLPDTPQDSLLEVGFTGCHCLLIRRDVVAEMERPWFQGYDPGGEDQYFCEKAFEMGTPTYVDLSVVVGHATTDRTIGLLDFMSAHRFLAEKQALETQEAAAAPREWRGA